MKLPIYFISDNHFFMDSPNNENYRRGLLFSLFEKIKKEHGTLVIGGDFFDFWFDYRGYIPHEYIDIFEKLRELKDSGCNIYYILGNHDYWDFGFFNKMFTKHTFKDEYIILDKDKKILIIHGDGVLPEDSGYRLFRRIIRSKLCIFLFKTLSPKIGYYIASKISHADKPATYYKDSELLKSRLTEYARTRFDDVDVLLMGHYHQSGIIEEKDKKLIFLGDWLTKYLVTVYDNGQWNQIHWNK